MINLYNQVPSVYPSASRDFQYLCWLTNVVLNSVKHNVDDIYNLPSTTIDSKIAELLAMTLGFKIKRNYDQKQLIALVSILPTILKYKGTIKAIEMAVEALLTSSGATGDLDYTIDGAQLIVTMPKELIDTTLFTDLLDYILPAGMTCRIIRKTQTKLSLPAIEITHHDVVHLGLYDELSWRNNQSTGLSSLYDLEQNNSEFNANFTTNDLGELVLNAGLLNNTIIPSLNGHIDYGLDDSVVLYTTEVDAEGNKVAEPFYSKSNTGDGLHLLEAEKLYPPREN